MFNRLAVATVAALALMISQPEVDPKTVPADALRAYQEFWTTLSAGESAALERDLDRVDARARHDKPVDNDLAKLRAGYPELARLEPTLEPVRWIAAESPGPTYVCSGLAWIGRNGRVRCIGGYRTQ